MRFTRSRGNPSKRTTASAPRTDARSRFPAPAPTVGLVRGLPDTYEMDAYSPWASRSSVPFAQQVARNADAAQVARWGTITVRPATLGDRAYDPTNPAAWTDSRD